MNSAEQKDYERATPSEEQIEETIQMISRKLQHPVTNREENLSIKNGYREAIKILVGNIRSYGEIDLMLEAGTSLSIAVMAVDYLNGECSQKALLAIEPAR
jgi:Holliday junction resolvase-like predicted endonuclease